MVEYLQDSALAATDLGVGDFANKHLKAEVEFVGAGSGTQSDLGNSRMWYNLSKVLQCKYLEV